MLRSQLIQEMIRQYGMLYRQLHLMERSGISDTDERFIYLMGKHDILEELLYELGYNTKDLQSFKKKNY